MHCTEARSHDTGELGRFFFHSVNMNGKGGWNKVAYRYAGLMWTYYLCVIRYRNVKHIMLTPFFIKLFFFTLPYVNTLLPSTEVCSKLSAMPDTLHTLKAMSFFFLGGGSIISLLLVLLVWPECQAVHDWPIKIIRFKVLWSSCQCNIYRLINTSVAQTRPTPDWNITRKRQKIVWF